MSKVFKSTSVIIGDKKEIDLLQVNYSNVIKLQKPNSNDNLDEAEENENEEIEKNPDDIINEAIEEAKRIIEEANKEATMIIEEAHQDSKIIYDRSKKDGFDEGYNAGIEKGYKEVDRYIQEAKDIKLEAMEDKNKIIKAAEKEMISLTIECVKKIINHSIEENHQLLLNLIEKGLEKATFTESIIIKVSEKDYQLVSSSKNKIFIMTEGIEKIDIKCDASLEAGSVVIETLSGTINAGIDTQIEAIKRLFDELLHSEG